MLKVFVESFFSTTELSMEFILEIAMFIIIIGLCFGGFSKLVNGIRR